MIMYKLSIVEKAKRYDEAIKKLRSLHDNYDIVSTLIDVKEELENIFPELAESEDEKVKKAILGMVYDSDNELWSSYDVSKSDVLAWLEKHSQVKEFPISQHKNKTCKENDDSLTSEDERIGKAITEFFKNYSKNGTWKAIPNVTKWIAWLEKQCELKFKVGDVVRSSNGVSILIVGITDYCYNCVTCATNDEYSFGFDIQDEFELVEQKPTEWSEEDEDAIGMAIIALEDMYDEDAPNTTYGGYNLPFNKAAERLKSLKDRFTWKPSEGQMVALNCAITAASDDLVCLNVKDLESLYEQLKKLREE